MARHVSSTVAPSPMLKAAPGLCARTRLKKDVTVTLSPSWKALTISVFVT